MFSMKVQAMKKNLPAWKGTKLWQGGKKVFLENFQYIPDLPWGQDQKWHLGELPFPPLTTHSQSLTFSSLGFIILDENSPVIF
jgi:hypothetical protein